MSRTQVRNGTIDLLKFIICPFILLIHCRLPGTLGLAVIHFGRFGVPFFLLVSGWFSYAHSTEKMVDYAKRKLFDTVQLLGTFSVAYFIMNSLSAFLSGKMCLSWISTYANVGTVVYLLLFNRALFFGSTGYYPFMLLYVYIIFIILLKRNLLDKAFITIPFLLACNISLSVFTNIPWFCYGNFLFTGLPLFLLGHGLHRIQARLPESPSFWFCMFLAGTGFTFLEAWVNKDEYCYIGSIIMATALLMFSFNYKLEVHNPAHVCALQRYSVYIFIVHCGIRDVLNAFLNRQQIVLSDYVFVILVILISLAVSVIWDHLLHIKTRIK